MLHKDLLIKLATARRLLAEIAEPPLSVQQVADAVRVSPYHFIRLFKSVFGVTPNQFQIQERLNWAKKLLRESDCSVTDICMEVGYASVGTFSDLFTRRVGMTPRQYRQKFSPLIEARCEVPGQLVPCCFSLMGGAPVGQRNIQEA